MECLAPLYLTTGQFLNSQPMRTLLTQGGKAVGDKLSSTFLTEALARARATEAAAIPTAVQDSAILTLDVEAEAAMTGALSTLTRI